MQDLSEGGGAMSIVVKTPGLLTIIQDGGCYGYQQYGVAPVGPMDQRAFWLGNLLAGNDKNESALEITMLGPQLQFNAPATIAVTGGDLQPTCNGEPLPMYCAINLAAGDVVSFTGPRQGCRAYLAVYGGFAVPAVMGSKSTQLKGQVGGFEGRKLQSGDVLPLCREGQTLPDADGRFMAPEHYPGGDISIAVLLGPQKDAFTDDGMKTFLSQPYTVGLEFDRMGYRLEGPAIGHTGEPGIISDGTCFGSVQVPGSGMPIVMMADHATVGGYTKIATVLSTELPKIAQSKTGDRFWFHATDIGSAQDAYIRQQEELDALQKRWNRPRPAWRMFQAEIDGRAFDIRVREKQ